VEALHDHCWAERPALPFDSNGPFVVILSVHGMEGGRGIVTMRAARMHY